MWQAHSLTPYGCKQTLAMFFPRPLECPPNLRKKSVYDPNFATFFVGGYLIKIDYIVCRILYYLLLFLGFGFLLQIVLMFLCFFVPCLFQFFEW